jgi:hypothetical protein
MNSNSKEFETELKKLDERFSVLENPNRPGLSNVYFMGLNYDLPVMSTNLIKDEIDQNYRYEFPNGMRARFWSKEEIMTRCVAFLEDFKKGKFKNVYE